MCSSMLLVVQSTIVTASIVRGSAPSPTTISLPRPCDWAVGAHSRTSQVARASSALTRRIRSPSIQCSGSVQLVEREVEARDERLQEIADLRQVEILDARPQGFLGLGELRVTGSGLLETLEIGAELVGGLHQVAVHAIARVGPEERLVARPERLGDPPEKPFLRCGLDRMVRALDLGIELLHRRRQVPGEDLAGVVVERERRGALGAHVAAEEPVADDRERVRDLGHPQAVLLDVLRIRAVHEPPAADELHPGQVGEEVTLGHGRRRAAQTRSFGSMVSRSQSPSRLTPSAVNASAAPGNSASHHATYRKSRLSESMLPHAGVGGWMPKPRKLIAASATMNDEN